MDLCSGPAGGPQEMMQAARDLSGLRIRAEGPCYSNFAKPNLANAWEQGHVGTPFMLL